MKEFNTTGLCVPDMHYMVRNQHVIDEMIELVRCEKYFTINRSRQYGKTTTLFQLENELKDEYEVISISFEGIGEGPFQHDSLFVEAFIDLIYEKMIFTRISQEDQDEWCDCCNYNKNNAMKWLSKKITQLCKKYPIILMIDEMDKNSDNQVFLNFLGMLREKYLLRSARKDYTFKSVILASVYDVKNLKLKHQPQTEMKYNSPWNIAVDFNKDMSFQSSNIENMLEEYKKDAHCDFDVEKISRQLHLYTNGYPFLVSWLCKYIDEHLDRSWCEESIKKAVKAFYSLDSTLKDDLIKNYENNDTLNQLIDDMLLRGGEYAFVGTDEAVRIGKIFGIFTQSQDGNNRLIISNIIFENILIEHILMKYARLKIIKKPEKSLFIKDDGHLDMVQVLNRFQARMKSEYREKDEQFYEHQGRLLFLCFLKPIINGTGFYYIEPETKSDTRMDLVVSYLDEEFIIELKIWHGEEYRNKGIQQLYGYLDSREQNNGYLLSFSFLKKKEYTAQYLNVDDKTIYEVVV